VIMTCWSLLAACNQEKTSVVETDTPIRAEKKSIVAAETPVPTSKPAESTVAPAPQEAAGEAVPITWDDFFDNGDQTKPSAKFNSLSGKKIELEGYMGEIINMNKGWFILIQQPGAECPFCSNDQTYWNKIMIVFVKEPNHLRYVPGKVKVTGTLDVDVKTDESGYTTMFRIYHAEFKAAE